ncbi:MAG: hypothetical protein J5I92_10650 [Thiogranum sp.]|nr:hypothetical protein [Thiogranum sp.]
MNSVSMNRPGVRESHLLRKRGNPLFDESRRDVRNEDLAQARLEDGLELDSFMEQFRALVQKAVDLQPGTPSETVLEIKEALDQSYQQACGLPGDQQQVKAAIKKLVASIMQAVRAGAGNDSFAQQQLTEEEIARETHYALQELPLVSALTHPDSPIAADELVPTLLSEADDALIAALVIFTHDQIAAICHDARAWLERKDPQQTLSDAWRRLRLIEDYYRSLQPASPAN